MASRSIAKILRGVDRRATQAGELDNHVTVPSTDRSRIIGYDYVNKTSRFKTLNLPPSVELHVPVDLKSR